MDESTRARAYLALRAEQAFGSRLVKRTRRSASASRSIEEAAIFRAPETPERIDVARRRVVDELIAPPTIAKPATSSSTPALIPLGPDRPPFDGDVRPREAKLELLQAMDRTEVKGCTKCRLSESRTHTVFGVGDVDAQLMFIGEGPGENEDLQGEPFVGRAGELLNKMILAMGLKREQVFIANIVKCRPPENRAPLPDETAACTPYLERQIEIIRPRVLVTLGLPASQYMLQTKLSMSKMRGQWHSWRGIKLMPTYHPAYLLRSYTPENRKAVWSDLQKVMSELGIRPTSFDTST